MAVAAGKDAALLLDGFSLTGFARSFAVSPEIDTHDSTVFGLNSRTKVPGLRHATATGELLYDDTEDTGSYDVLKSKYASTPGIVTFAPQGLTVGARAAMMYANEVSFSPAHVFDDLIRLNLTLEAAEDGVDFGVILHALGAETGTVNGTSVDNAALTSNGGVMVVHVTAIAGAAPSVVFKTQHSTNNSVWVDLVTGSAITAANTSQRNEVAAGTTVNRYLRTVVTFGGTTTSVTFATAFARR